MKKRSSLVFVCMVFCLVFAISSCGKSPGENSGESSNQSYSDNEAPVKKSHLSEVPGGYIGIYTPADLQNIQKNMAANYILMNDLDLSGYKFQPFKSEYSGTFDGNNYSVKNYSSNSPLFETISVASILNLSFDNALIDRAVDSNTWWIKDIGGIVGEIRKSGNETCNIKNCQFNGKIILRGESKESISVGGIAGKVYKDNCIIENCSFNGNIELADCSVNAVGGIVGVMNGALRYCYSMGLIKSDNRVGAAGGISGSQQCDISDCYSRINMQMNKCGEIGGICGSLFADASCLYYNGSFLNYNQLYVFSAIGGEMENKNLTAGAIAGGVESGKIQYCYYPDCGYTAVGDGTLYANVEALPKEAFSNEVSFKGFDFDNIWKMKKGDAPMLKNAQ